MSTPELKTQRLFGLDFVSEATLEEVAEAILRHPRSADADPYVITPNVDYLVQFNKPELLETSAKFVRSAFVLPDGMPIVWASRWLGRPLRSRLTGADLFPILWKRLCQSGRRVLIVVANAEIAEKLKLEMPNVVAYQPPFYRLEDTAAVEKVHQELLEVAQREQTEFLVMGIAAPKQQFMTLHLHQHLGDAMPLTLMIGASMEFYLGMRNRAPEWMRRSGLEWTHRLAMEPKRMFKRYIIDGVRFAPLVMRERRLLVKEQRER